MDKKQIKIIGIILSVLGIFAIGFFLGRKMTPAKEIKTIKYVKGDPITDTLYKPVPVKVVEPIDTVDIIKECIENGLYAELFPEKEIIKEIYRPTSEDTLAILKDWATERYYSEILFDNDTTGRFVIDVNMQYNRLAALDYEFTPVYKEVTKTIYKEPLFSPFVGAGIGYQPMVSLQAGAFIKERHGFSVTYFRDLDYKRDFVGINYLYKF